MIWSNSQSWELSEVSLKESCHLEDRTHFILMTYNYF